MVLQELGSQLMGALKKMTSSVILDSSVTEQLVSDVSRALLDADVNASIVTQFAATVSQKIDLNNIPSGQNPKRYIHQTIIEELTKLVNPGKAPWRPVLYFITFHFSRNLAKPM